MFLITLVLSFCASSWDQAGDMKAWRLGPDLGPLPYPFSSLMELEPISLQLSTYHIGIGEVEPNEDIQVTRGQPCGQTRVRTGQRGGPHSPDPCLVSPHLGAWAS